MRILYLITQADGGGAQNYALALAQNFRGAIAAGREAGELFEAAEKNGLKTFRLNHLKRNINPYHDLMAIWEIRQLIQTYQPDILHLNSSKAGILGSFAGIGLKTKIVFTAHGFVFNEPLPWPVRALYIVLEKAASRCRDCVITVSEKDRTAALRHKIIAPEKIVTIHNGLPALNFLPPETAAEQLNLPKNLFLFATIANFYKTKGLHILVDAVTLLKQEVKNQCKFVIFGNGPEEQNIKLRLKNSGLAGNFLLLGKTNQAYQYLKAFNAFLLPSLKEGFPYVILEALAAGLPILATTAGGLPEAVDEAGLLVKPGNAAELAEKIGQMVFNQNLRTQLADKARERSQLFTLQKMLSETEDMYKKILP